MSVSSASVVPRRKSARAAGFRFCGQEVHQRQLDKLRTLDQEAADQAVCSLVALAAEMRRGIAALHWFDASRASKPVAIPPEAEIALLPIFLRRHWVLVVARRGETSWELCDSWREGLSVEDIQDAIEKKYRIPLPPQKLRVVEVPRKMKRT